MNATTIVRALLDSDEDLLYELGQVAINPVVAPIKFALERGQEFNQRVVDNGVLNGFVLDIGVKPVGGAWALKNGSRMMSIRWFHNTSWGARQHGGGFFFVRPGQLTPYAYEAFMRELGDMIKEASRVVSADANVRNAYNRLISYRYSSPRESRREGRKHTETGLFAYS